MSSPSTLEWVATALLALALLHTFCAPFFLRRAHHSPRHAGLWHLLGEVEVVFGFWAVVLVLALLALGGLAPTLHYLEGRSFVEPLFVGVILLMAGTRPVLLWAHALVQALARRLPLPPAMALYFLVLSLIPLLGSLITEPAAMTVAALMLRDTVFRHALPARLQYLTLGVLLVNVSVGGTLTHFAAPPVLMVAHVWQWDTPFMWMTFGWKSTLAVLINAGLATLLMRRVLGAQSAPSLGDAPQGVMGSAWINLGLMGLVVLCAHHPVLFIGVGLVFLGWVQAYPRQHERLMVREALMVAFFLAGLVVLGGLQTWWLRPALQGLEADAVFWGAMALTAVTDNAALTYLASLVPGLSDGFKVALVAGAVTGGGLTVMANAPNPAGVAILRPAFARQQVLPGPLLLAALAPTLITAAVFVLSASAAA